MRPASPSVTGSAPRAACSTHALPATSSCAAFLQHVLPKGLHKIRYFGLWHPSQRKQAARARLLLQLHRSAHPAVATSASEPSDDAAAQSPASVSTEEARICPNCKAGRLVEIGRIYPKQASGP